MCHQRYFKYLSDGIFYYKIYGTNILDEKIKGIIQKMQLNIMCII